MGQPLSLNLRYFALLREQAGLERETIASTAATPAALYAELATRHAFTLPQDNLRVAVNDRFVPMDTTLTSGDTIAFIPPVAGG